MSKILMITVAVALSAATATQAQMSPRMPAEKSEMPMNHGEMRGDRPMAGERGGEGSMAGMHDRMMGAARGGPAESFHRQMIEHHRGGVMMARQVLGKTRDRQTIALAKRIIRDQQREISEMQAWLRRNGKTPQ